jgi:hypothetical protein
MHMEAATSYEDLIETVPAIAEDDAAAQALGGGITAIIELTVDEMDRVGGGLVIYRF